MEVVLLDGLKLIAEILLDHVFHVRREVGQALLDMWQLGPDPAGDQLFIVIGEVHERGEVLPQAYGVDDGETDLAGWE